MFTHEGDAVGRHNIQRRGSRPGKQPKTRVRIPRGERRPHNANLSIEVDRCIRNARCSFRQNTLELYDRPSAPLEIKIWMLRADVLETVLCDCVTWSPRACQYDTLRQAHHSFLTRCIGCRKINRTDHPISCLDTLMKPGRESLEAIM